MTYWRNNRWVLPDADGVTVAWIVNISDRFLLGIVGGPQAWYDSLAQAMTAGEVHVRNEALMRGVA